MTPAQAQTTTTSRDAVNEMVQASALTAIEHPEFEDAERLRILGYLLDPQIAVIDRAVHSYERGNPFPTTERDLISSYTTRAMERKILGLAGTDDASMVKLDVLAAGTPLAWADRFARACVQHGVTEVRRDRKQRGTGLSGSTPLAPAVESAEDAYINRKHDDVVDAVADAVASWDRSAMSKHEVDRAVATQLRRLRQVPPLNVGDVADRRWVMALLDSDEGQQMILESLKAFKDMSSASPKWEQMGVDERLFDLWMNYSAEQADGLSSGKLTILIAIVRGSVAIPPRPQEAQRIAVRRITKGMCATKGWPTLVMELEKAWAAEFFSVRTARANMDRRSDEEAEADRVRDAAGWVDAAERVLQFPGAPLGQNVRTVDGVAAWLDRALQLIEQR